MPATPTGPTRARTAPTGGVSGTPADALAGGRAGPAASAASGAVAAAMALAAGELVVGVAADGGPSLVSAVGTEVIDRYAASLKDLAVSLFGTNDKVALVVGIVAVSLLLGAALGLAARRHRWLGAAGFVAFGVLGLTTYVTDPLGSIGVGLASSAAAVAAGWGSLWWLLGLADRADRDRAHRDRPGRAAAGPRDDSLADRPSTPAGPVEGVLEGGRLVPAPRSPMDPRLDTRRAFLVTTAAVGAGAAAVAVLGRRLAGRGRSEAARAEVVLPRPVDGPAPAVGQPFEVRDLTPYVTANDDFYRIDTALTIPQTDTSSWRLTVDGLVDRPYSISYEELIAMDSVAETVTIACVSNEVGGDLVGNAVWQGVPLTALLDRAGVGTDAEQVVGTSLDGWTAGFPLSTATDGRVAMVAYAMNDEPLPVRHGFPARLIVAGLYGYVSATKWLSRLTLDTWEGTDGYWISRGWSKEGPIKTQSRIDVPRGGQHLTPGPTPIAGVAWAPTRGIERVEVRIDDRPWTECRLGRTTGDDTWVQWLHEWNATPGDHLITVRATDGDGHTQPAEVSRPDPDGATGWHTRSVRVGSA